ncbi:MAG: hypothetical protein P1P64_00780 [Treponemataceae bacterium]
MKRRLNKLSFIKQVVFFGFVFLIFTLVVLIFVCPLLNISFKLFSYGSSFPQKRSSLRVFDIAGFTIFQAFISSLCASLLGLALAYFCAVKKIRFKKFLLSLASIPVAVPPLIISLSYVFFLAKKDS